MGFDLELAYLDAAFTTYFLISLVISAAIGALIGERKGRLGAGALFGVLLGPLGWLIVALGPNMKPKCRACGGVLNPNAIKCVHCGSDVGHSARGAGVPNRQRSQKESSIEKVVFNCEWCGNRLEALIIEVGSVIQCHNCDSDIVVPESEWS